MENSQVQTVEVMQAETLQSMDRAEIDMQIATAKRFPRNIQQCLDNIRALSMIDEETMESCFYHLERKDKDGQIKEIEGMSVRMAEIFVSCWGNLRVATRIIGNDGRKITAQGICFDVQNNVAVSSETSRRITNKSGKTYSDDMQIVTGNAASAIAFRNAVFKVIPAAVTKSVTNEIKQKLLEMTSTKISQKRRNAVEWFTKRGVTEDELRKYLGTDNLETISAEKIVELRGVATAIREGSSSIDEVFRSNSDDRTVSDRKEEIRARGTAPEVEDMP